MPPARLAQHAAAAGAQHQALLDQERLDHVFQRVARLGQRGGQGLHADRPAGMVLGDAPQVAPVHRVQPEPVDLQPGSAASAMARSIGAVAGHRGEVAHPAQQPAGDARRAARAAGDLGGALGGQRRSRASRAPRATISSSSAGV